MGEKDVNNGETLVEPMRHYVRHLLVIFSCSSLGFVKTEKFKKRKKDF